jgi:hypothetical protein
VFKLAVRPSGIPEHRHSVRTDYPLFRRSIELPFNLAVRPHGIPEHRHSVRAVYPLFRHSFLNLCLTSRCVRAGFTSTDIRSARSTHSSGVSTNPCLTSRCVGAGSPSTDLLVDVQKSPTLRTRIHFSVPRGDARNPTSPRSRSSRLLLKSIADIE